MSRIVGITALGLSLLAIGCGGGSSPATNQPPVNQSPAGVTIATGSHILGNAGAKVTIIEFCDFQCPYCKSYYTSTESQIIDEYVNTGKATLAFRQFPISFHVNAQIAAQASECAAKVGGNDAFWKYHDKLFTNGYSDGTGLDAASLKQYAADLQLDTASFNSCLDNHQTATIVSKDYSDGVAAGVQGTPSFFINGKYVFGAPSTSDFKAMLDAALAQ